MDYEANLIGAIKSCASWIYDSDKVQWDDARLRSILRAHLPGQWRCIRCGATYSKPGAFTPDHSPDAGEMVDARELATLIERDYMQADNYNFDTEGVARLLVPRLAARGQEGADQAESLRRIIAQQNTEREALVKNMHDLIDAADARANAANALLEKAESEAKALRAALKDEHAVRVMMMEWAEKHHPPKGRDLLAYVQVRKANTELDERTRAALRESAPGTEEPK